MYSKCNKLLVFFLLCSSIVFSQNTDLNSNPGDGITLSVVMPSVSDFNYVSTLTKLKNKIIQITGRYNITGVDYSSEFLITPKLDIYESEVVEAGLRNVYIVKGELSLYIMQLSTKKIFSTFSKSLKGSGSSRQKAMNNMISQLSSRDLKISDFINTGKKRIIDFYEGAYCNQIKNKAEGLISRREYNKAVALLSQVPSEATQCNTEIQHLLTDAYFKSINLQCQSNITKSKAALANNDYDLALRYLSRIDPESTCKEEAFSMINSIDTTIDEELKEKQKVELKKYNDQQAMEKFRIRSIADVKKSYYNSQKTPETIIYKSLF